MVGTKKLFKPASLVLYLLMFIAFFMAGIFYAVMIEAGKNQMLAGGAIVLGWGVLFGGIAFVASLFIAWYTKPAIIKRLNWALLVIIIVIIGIARYLNPREDYIEPEDPEQPTKPTAPAADAVDAEPAAMLITDTVRKLPESNIRKFLGDSSTSLGILPHCAQSDVRETKSQLNIGFFKPNFYDNRTLYFYGGVNL